MSIIPYGVVIYSKELSNSKNLNSKVSREFLCNIRKHTGKPKESFVTAVGSITHMGIRKEQDKPFLFWLAFHSRSQSTTQPFDSNPYQVNAIPNRIVIYAKDIVNITGCSLRTAQRILAQVRKQYKKDKHSFVSVQEFCAFSGLSEEKVSAFLLWSTLRD